MEFNIENVVVNNENIVRLTIGGQVLDLSIEDAFNLSESIEIAADRPGFESYIDEVFDNWGNEGGTC